MTKSIRLFVVAAALWSLASIFPGASPAQAVQLCNNAWENTATTGTGSLVVSGAVSGAQTIEDCGITNGQSIRYRIFDGSAWEVGTGTYTTADNTLTRTVIESSNSDTAISLSGTATVIVTPLKQDLPSESTPIEATPTASDYLFMLQSGAFERVQISALEATLEGFLDAADLQGDIVLNTDTSGDYVATVADGTGIDGTATGEASTYTPSLDLTEVSAPVVGNGTTSSIQVGTIELGAATDTTIARASAGNITVEGNNIYRAGGTDVAIGDGGTGASLSDPAGHRLLAWDDTANQVEFQDAGTGLTTSATTLDCDTPTETAVGCIELATTGEAETGTDTSRAVTAAGVLAAVTGKKPIWIPGGSLTPRTTNGCAIADLELATNDIMLRTCNYDTATEEGAGFTIRMPDTWNEGTLTVTPVWAHPSTTTNFGVVWGFSCLATSNDDAMDAALGSQVTSTDTGGTTTDQYTGPETAAMTCSGTPAAGDTIYIEAERVVANGSDTMAVDAYLLGFTVYYTDNAFVEP